MTLYCTFLFLVIVHVLADWALQPRWMVYNKSRDPGIMLLHGGTIVLALYIVYVIKACVEDSYAGMLRTLGLLGLYGITHMGQDYLMWKLYCSKIIHNDTLFYIAVGLNQALHFSILFWIALFI